MKINNRLILDCADSGITTHQEIQEIYKLIEQYHTQYLAPCGVNLPKLKDGQGRYTKNALVLVRLAKNYPDTISISKQELTDFVRQFYPDTIDVQQARHLTMQNGFFIVSGTRGDRLTEEIPSGSYKLITLEKAYPAFSPNRHIGFDNTNFEELKQIYHNRCATCGSKEGQSHLFRQDVIVSLQKGHINPILPLEGGNVIPQCQICNRADRNRFVYDRTGRVTAIADTPDGFRVVEKFILNASLETQELLYQLLK